MRNLLDALPEWLTKKRLLGMLALLVGALAVVGLIEPGDEGPLVQAVGNVVAGVLAVCAILGIAVPATFLAKKVVKKKEEEEEDDW